MSEVPVGEPYKGPSGIARDSTWLSSEDLPHEKDTVVTIEVVRLRRNLTMQGGRPKPVGLSLKFVGKSRELLLNATNRKTLAALFETNECGAWFGKTIALFIEQDVRRPDGTKGPAVRIRAKRIAQQQPAAQAAQSESIDQDFERAAIAAEGKQPWPPQSCSASTASPTHPPTDSTPHSHPPRASSHRTTTRRARPMPSPAS